jgi:hypothetical protein
MSALDTIKNYRTGDSVQSDTSQPPVDSRATYYVGGPKAAGIKGDIAVDATQTEEILKRMQTFIDQRESPLALLMGGLNKAYATTYGPGAALDYQKQQDVEDRQVLDYRTQMAAYRAAQAQAERDAALYAKKMGAGTGSAGGAAPAPGTGAGETPQGQMTYDGIPVPDSVKARLKGTSAHDTPILNEWLKTKTTERIKKEESPSMAAVTQVFGVGDMTVAQAEKYLQNSGLTYTIVRPGGLLNYEKIGGLVMSGADTLFEGSIPRTKVAQVTVEALFEDTAKNKLVEIVVGTDSPDLPISKLFAKVA